MFDYGSYQWNNRYRANLILWGGFVMVGNELKNSFGSLSLRENFAGRSRTGFFLSYYIGDLQIKRNNWSEIPKIVGSLFPRL